MPDDSESPFWIHIPPGQPPQSRGRSTDRAVRGDDAFFKRHPHRRHRIRLASHDERARALPEALPRDREIYTAVRNVADGCRLRVYYADGAGSDTDVDEIIAQVAFELAAPALAEPYEAVLRKVLAGQPGAPPPAPIAAVMPPEAAAWQGTLPVLTLVPGAERYVGSFWNRDRVTQWIPAADSADGDVADRKFFARHPHRQHYVRRANPFERDRSPDPVPGERDLYVVVNDGPRISRRLFLAAATACWDGVGEAIAQIAFAAAGPQAFGRERAGNGDDDAGPAS